MEVSSSVERNKDDYRKWHFKLAANSPHALEVLVPNDLVTQMGFRECRLFSRLSFYDCPYNTLALLFSNPLQIETALFLWNGKEKYVRPSGNGNGIISGLIVELLKQYMSVDTLKLSMTSSERTTKYKIQELKWEVEAVKKRNRI